MSCRTFSCCTIEEEGRASVWTGNRDSLPKTKVERENERKGNYSKMRPPLTLPSTGTATNESLGCANQDNKYVLAAAPNTQLPIHHSSEHTYNTTGPNTSDACANKRSKQTAERPTELHTGITNWSIRKVFFQSSLIIQRPGDSWYRRTYFWPYFSASVIIFLVLSPVSNQSTDEKDTAIRVKVLTS